MREEIQTNQVVGADRILVIGMGNAYRGDDAAGLIVARRLSDRRDSTFNVLEHNGDGTGLMEAWKDAGTVVVIDAVHSGAEPGTIHRFDANLKPLPAATFRCSTHAFSLVEAIELTRALSRLPRRLVVYGIEGQDFQGGSEPSPRVEAAVQVVMDRVLHEIQALSCSALLSA